MIPNSELWLPLSKRIAIVSQYDIYVKDAVLDALSPPIFNLLSDRYLLSLFEKRSILVVISQQLNK